MNRPIGVFDSGIGGLTILKELIKVLPNEDFIYYADSLHNPYGLKNEDELLDITLNIVDYLLSKNCKIIVIACNTATTMCMKKLRRKYFDTVFVGVVPAIKVAYDHDSKNTLVLATPYTVGSKRVDELVTAYKHNDQNITLLPCHNLANTIEFGSRKDIIRVFDKEIKEHHNQCFDAIVLGCTHYYIIRDIIQDYFPNAEIIDGNRGVALEVRHQLGLKKELSSIGNGSIEFINSDKNYKSNLKDILESIK